MTRHQQDLQIPQDSAPLPLPDDCHLCVGICVLPGCPYALYRDDDGGAAHEPETA